MRVRIVSHHYHGYIWDHGVNIPYGPPYPILIMTPTISRTMINNVYDINIIRVWNPIIVRNMYYHQVIIILLHIIVIRPPRLFILIAMMVVVSMSLPVRVIPMIHMHPNQ